MLRSLVGLGDVYKRQVQLTSDADEVAKAIVPDVRPGQTETETRRNNVAEPQSESESDEIDMASLEHRLESLMDDSDDDEDYLTDDQLLHLAKYQPELLTKSQLLTVVRIVKPTAQSST